MTKPIVVHRQDFNNVGDMASNPLRYFMQPDEYDVIDVINIHKERYDANRPIVVGGGGLIANEFLGDDIRNVLYSNDYAQLLEIGKTGWSATDVANKDLRDNFNTKIKALVKEYIDQVSMAPRAPRILWGAGHNGELAKKVKQLSYPSYMVQFDKVGIRDDAQEYPWVPCASCMLPALRQKYAVKHDIIWFEHKKQLIKGNDFGDDSVMRVVNSGNNAEATIEILGSANTIVTNSYHGAYWGTLLKKRVIVVEPWSSKFLFMKHPPTFVQKNESWRNYLETTEMHVDSLDECINVTEQFWRETKQLL